MAESEPELASGGKPHDLDAAVLVMLACIFVPVALAHFVAVLTAAN